MQKGGEIAKYEPFESEQGKELEDQEILRNLAERLEIGAVIQYTDKNIAKIKSSGLPLAPKTVPKQKGPICYNCNEVGHIKRVCPKKFATSPSTPCPRCGQPGHWSKECDLVSDLMPVSGSVTLEDQHGYQHTFALTNIICRQVGAKGSAKYEFSASVRVPEWDLGQGRIAENLRRVKIREDYMNAFEDSESID
ncbi:hypothetical protein N7G274_004263 [Stereocaulon virgatum]|uniref:CCHC-type domain-containing protein n=1 Tax=Stereocaulon virgatum TaxID=373712 RepID=A0ABR4ADQ8_9LECA